MAKVSRSKSAKTPYSNLPATAFWRSGVAEAGIFGLEGLWTSKWYLPPDARFVSFGSCFAQHISAALRARKMNWLDAEPAPNRTPTDLARAYGYGLFSARTGNVYTAAQLRYLVGLASGSIAIEEAEFWPERGGRVRDSLRPAIEPEGFADAEEALRARATLARALRRAIELADVFVFTLGLTEGWRNRKTGQPYPMCPGTLGGRFDAKAHEFDPASYAEIHADLTEAIAAMRAINPELRILFTVSPVPLVATASGQHVLKATTYSKATLRALAGDLAAEPRWIDYFPAYELVAGAPARAMFFEPDLRSVSTEGVTFVMRHFLAGLRLSKKRKYGRPKPAPRRDPVAEAEIAAEDAICEELVLEQNRPT